MGESIAAGNAPLDSTSATTNAVQTELREEDREAMAASKDGIQQGEPMQFGISGSPTAQPEQQQEPLEEDEEYEDEGEEET